MSKTEICEKLDKSPNALDSVYRQKTFNDLVAKEIREDGNVTSFLDGLVIDSLMTVVNIRDDQKNDSKTRLAAANSLIDRSLGRPAPNVKQINTKEDKSSADPVEELARLQQEIAREQAKAKV